MWGIRQWTTYPLCQMFGDIYPHSPGIGEKMRIIKILRAILISSHNYKPELKQLKCRVDYTCT